MSLDLAEVSDRLEIHDVLIALTFLLAMRLEFSLNVVAALLTIVGYSINDTVVT